MGVVDVVGHFAQQEAVRLVAVDSSALPVMGSQSPADGLDDKNGTDSPSTRPKAVRPLSISALAIALTKGEEVGRAVVNYSSAEVARIKGLKSSEIGEVLGYAETEYVAFRENVSLYIVDKSRPETPTRSQTPAGSRTPDLSRENGDDRAVFEPQITA